MSLQALVTDAIGVGYRRGLRPLLFRVGGGDPERAHEAMLRWLARVPATRHARTSDPVTVAGIQFPNRVGLAAGMDKDGVAAAAWARLGFGFAELGTVTAQAQPGNPQPRMFRLPESRAVINRMGFNNHGARALAQRLTARGVERGNRALGIPLGISIGKTKAVAVEDAVDDYLESLRALHTVADYVAVNVSSPNTPGLRSLQAADELASLLGALTHEAAVLSPSPLPIFVKLSPDMEESELLRTIEAIEESGASGIIATNTTLRRDGLSPAEAHLAPEPGGLSGRPLTARSLRVLETVATRTALPVMGSGGVMSPADAHRMLDAGARLVQLYTGFIYEGLALVRGIREL